MTSIHNVAAQVLESMGEPISSMKLHKLMFLSQAWSLALIDEALFPEDFQVRGSGPFCRTLWEEHGDEANLISDWSKGDSNLLPGKHVIVIDAIIRQYGGLSGPQLARIIDEQLSEYLFSDNHVIFHDEIQRFYKEILALS